MDAFGDSETESDDDDDEEDEEEGDDEDLDSVSVVAAVRGRRQQPGSRISHLTKLDDATDDSGRGESPEASSSSVSPGQNGQSSVVSRRTSSGAKAPRPISAVPSELSDISTRSGSSECEEQAVTAAEKGVIASSIPPAEESSPASPVKAPELSREERMERAHMVAKELLSTEEQYVKSLYLIDQVSEGAKIARFPLGGGRGPRTRPLPAVTRGGVSKAIVIHSIGRVSSSPR